MTRNYVGYFKTCLLALILCLSKIYPRLLILSVAESENLNLCDECSHCSLWGLSSQIFSLSDSTTYNKNASPIQCSNVENKPYTMVKTVLSNSGHVYQISYFLEVTGNFSILMNIPIDHNILVKSLLFVRFS